MEKFAIDLDKVLDDFEFNEDCAEQIASVTPSVTNASSSTSKSGLEPSTLKTCNYVAEPGKPSTEFETVSPPEKHKESQLVHTENRCTNERDTTIDNLNYNKGESTAEDTDSVNHFFTHEHTNDSKLTQKQTVPPSDLEQTSLTIYNDISEKLLQKQQNGSSSPKIDNRYDNRSVQPNRYDKRLIQRSRYDKKLNQPDIKRSISIVFSSLNEYINAPPGSLDHVHAVTERQEMEHNTNSDTTQERNDESTCNAVGTYFETVETVTKITDIGTEHGETNNLTDEVKETSILDYQDSIVPVTIESFTTCDSDIEQSSARDIATTSEKAEVVEVIDQNVIGNAKHPDEKTCNYEEASIHTPELSYQPVGESSSKLEDTNEKIYINCNFERAYDDVHGSEQNTGLPPERGNSEHESTYIQSQENTVATPVQSSSTASMPDTETLPVGNTVTKEKASSNLNDKCVRTSGTVRKPVGFSNIGPSSEEELTKYLAEIEQERLKGKDNMYQITLPSTVHEVAPESSVQSMLHNRIDEDMHEAPIFENVIIGELPKISEAELQEKAKKFPIIDYSKEQSDKDALSGPFEKQILEEHNDETKPALMEQECKLKGEKCRDISDTINDSSDNAQSRKYEDPVQPTGNDVKHVDNFNVSERDDVLDEKSSQDSQEHMYNICTDQGSSSNTKTEAQLKENLEDVSDSTNYPSSCKLERESDSDCNYKESEAHEAKVLDDNAKCSSDVRVDPVEVSTNSSINESSDESDKPLRPQTLDIVLPDNMDEHEIVGSTNDTSSGQAQSTVDGAKDECHESSPDVLDNSFIDPISVLGKQPPFWVPDSEAPSCMLCDVKFTVLKRRHHCRACGKVLCNKCCNMKYKLEYQGNIDSRVCVSCYELLTKAETDQGMLDWSSSYSSYMSTNDINSPQGRQPNPNNPMEYCSTIPPLQQLAGGLPPPPTVMVPVGVLKREGGTKTRPEGSKSVMFSDGIRPGCDLTELDMSWDRKPPYRKPGNKRLPTPGSSVPSTAAKRQNLPRLDPITESYVPMDPDAYPPTVSIHKGQVSYQTVTDEGLLYKTLKNECEPPVMFAINRNLYAYVKITNLNCCVNKICWNVTSRGLACVGQDEVILLVETLPDETRIPKDLLIFINQLFIEAIKGNTVSELGFSIYHGGNLLSSREHAGFLFIRQTLQCLQKIVLPPAPFLVGLLVHRWETPWAKVFPLRLLLRLGAEYRYYPCPLVSVRFRDALYFEIGHTVMKVLADFRNFGYTLPGVRGLTIHLRNRMTDVMFPRNRYDQVIKGLNNSNDHVLAYASNFSISADSHLVCIQTNKSGESSYQTQAINIHNKPRTVTGASFIVINGALKSSTCLSAKSSIVEDGLMVEIMPEKMEALKAALKNMQDFSIGCGRQGAPEPDETVNIKWVDNDVQFNLGVKSPIDAQLMDGIPSIRVHNGTDYKGTSRFIRWTEVFIIKSDDHPTGVHDPVDINKLSGNIAKATCTALVKLLDLLATAGLTKLGVRTTIHPDNVGYEAGSEGTKLPPIYMNSLDNELIQVLHKAAQCSQDAHTVLELIFYVLDD